MSKKTLFGHEWQRDVKAIWGLFFLLLALSALTGMIGGWFFVRDGLPVNILMFFRFVWAAVQGWPWDGSAYPDTYARAVFWYGPAIAAAVFATLWFGILAIARRNNQQEGV